MNTKANSQRTWLETITTWPAYPVRGQLQWWLDCRTRHTSLLRRTGKGTVRAEHLTPAAVVYFEMSSVPQDIERRWRMMNCEGCVRKRQWFRTGNIPTFSDVTEKLAHRIGMTSWDLNLPPAEYKSRVLPLHQTMRRFYGHFSPCPRNLWNHDYTGSSVAWLEKYAKLT